MQDSFPSASYEYLDHAADLGIRVRAPTLEQLFQSAGDALMNWIGPADIEREAGRILDEAAGGSFAWAIPPDAIRSWRRATLAIATRYEMPACPWTLRSRSTPSIPKSPR